VRYRCERADVPRRKGPEGENVIEERGRVRVRFAPSVRVMDWDEVVLERVEAREEGSVSSYCVVLSLTLSGADRRLVLEFSRVITEMGRISPPALALAMGNDSTGTWKRAASYPPSVREPLTVLTAGPVMLVCGEPVPRKRPYEREAMLPAAWRVVSRLEERPRPRRLVGVEVEFERSCRGKPLRFVAGGGLEGLSDEVRWRISVPEVEDVLSRDCEEVLVKEVDFLGSRNPLTLLTVQEAVVFEQ
jgi:hypothetical protein